VATAPLRRLAEPSWAVSQAWLLKKNGIDARGNQQGGRASVIGDGETVTVTATTTTISPLLDEGSVWFVGCTWCFGVHGGFCTGSGRDGGSLGGSSAVLLRSTICIPLSMWHETEIRSMTLMIELVAVVVSVR
jgi:hypothetical protein